MPEPEINVPRETKLCSRCREVPPREGQRYCQPCHNAYVRENRAKNGESLKALRQRAETAEAALDRIRALADEWATGADRGLVPIRLLREALLGEVAQKPQRVRVPDNGVAT